MPQMHRVSSGIGTGRLVVLGMMIKNYHGTSWHGIKSSHREFCMDYYDPVGPDARIVPSHHVLNADFRTCSAIAASVWRGLRHTWESGSQSTVKQITLK